MAKKKTTTRGTKKVAKKSAKKSAVRKTAKKSSQGRASASPARRATRSSRRAPAPKRNGVITHTELASGDPLATRYWCESVLGWEFGEAMPTPAGPYHMWRFGIGTGGGIRSNNASEAPGSIPYCEVANIQATYRKAIEEGATEMMPPAALPGGMGWIAIVAAPGGVPIGFWSAG